MKVIFHTIGASLLTNYLHKAGNSELKSLLNKKVTELSISEKSQLDNYLQQIEKDILSQDANTLMKYSAETNAIVKYWEYRKNKNKMPDYAMHYLLVTDTYIGSEIGKILKSAIKHNPNLGAGISDAEVIAIKNLNTDSIDNFRKGLAQLTKEVLKLINEEGNAREIFTFNLSGGFKGVLAYLNTIANLYAEETIYIFENARELLVIPSFPIERLSPTNMQIIQEHFMVLRKVNMNMRVNPSQLNKLDNFYIEKCGDVIDFTDYGRMIFNEYQQTAYQQQLFAPISNNVEFGKQFVGSTKHLSKEELQRLNQQLDLLAAYHELGANLNKLDYKKLAGKNTRLGINVSYEFDAFGGSDSRRCYCNQKEGKIIVEVLDKHL